MDEVIRVKLSIMTHCHRRRTLSVAVWRPGRSNEQNLKNSVEHFEISFVYNENTFS